LFGEIKPYIGSLKNGRLDLVYYRDPGLKAGDRFPLWTLHCETELRERLNRLQELHILPEHRVQPGLSSDGLEETSSSQGRLKMDAQIFQV
jgi:hypothetical protein